MTKLFEGKTKDLFSTDDPQELLIAYKDLATTHDGFHHSKIPGKGIVNNRVTNLLMRVLEGKGIRTDLIREVDDRTALVRKLDMIPLEIIIRNIAAGSLVERLGIPEGTRLTSTVLEYNYKSDELDDPMVNEFHVVAMNWATGEQMKEMARLSEQINVELREIFARVGILLVDFKLEFGLNEEGQLILADEISPDTCRLRDMCSGEELDKDHFVHDYDGTEENYQEVLRRLLEMYPDEAASVRT